MFASAWPTGQMLQCEIPCYPFFRCKFFFTSWACRNSDTCSWTSVRTKAMALVDSEAACASNCNAIDESRDPWTCAFKLIWQRLCVWCSPLAHRRCRRVKEVSKRLQLIWTVEPNFILQCRTCTFIHHVYIHPHPNRSQDPHWNSTMSDCSRTLFRSP